MQCRYRLPLALLRGSLLALLAGWIALAPVLAEARAGGGSSSTGTRGARTYEGNNARPMERSVTPQAQQPNASAPLATAPSSTLGASAGLMQRHPFLSGIAGGFIGAGIVGMLFGQSAWAADGGIAGGLGMLLQLLVVAGMIVLAFLAVRVLRNRRHGAAAAGMDGDGDRRSAGASPDPAAQGDAIAIPLSEGDRTQWSALLVGIQEAWSKGDVLRFKQFMTPEMVGYFNAELAQLASAGVENRVEQVDLLKGDVEEAWREGAAEYVTASALTQT